MRKTVVGFPPEVVGRILLSIFVTNMQFHFDKCQHCLLRQRASRDMGMGSGVLVLHSIVCMSELSSLLAAYNGWDEAATSRRPSRPPIFNIVSSVSPYSPGPSVINCAAVTNCTFEAYPYRPGLRYWWNARRQHTSVSRTPTMRRYGCGRLSKNERSGSTKSTGAATSRATINFRHSTRLLYHRGANLMASCSGDLVELQIRVA